MPMITRFHNVKVRRSRGASTAPSLLDEDSLIVRFHPLQFVH